MSDEITLETSSPLNEELSIDASSEPIETDEINDINEDKSEIDLGLNENLTELPNDSLELEEAKILDEAKNLLKTNLGDKEMSFDLPLDDNVTEGAESNVDNVVLDDDVQTSSPNQDAGAIGISSDENELNSKAFSDNMELPLGDENRVEATIDNDDLLVDSGAENGSMKGSDNDMLQELPLDDSEPLNPRTASQEEFISDLHTYNENEGSDLDKITPDDKEGDNISVYDEEKGDDEIAEISDEDKMMMDDLPMDENDTRPRKRKTNNASSKQSADEDDIVLVDDDEENNEDVKKSRKRSRRDENEGSDVGEEEEDGVEEVNYSSSDSEIMEVDAEDPDDPLASPTRKPSKSKSKDSSGSAKDKVEILDDSKVPKPNDKPVRGSRRQSQEKTPTKKGSNKFQVQEQDPDVPDDTFVVEAPSFIVPYVYEKLPKESVTEFKRSIARLEYQKTKQKAVEAEEKRRKEEDEMKAMRALPLDGEDGMGKVQQEMDDQMNEERREFDEEQERLDQEAEERILNDIKERVKKPPSNFFESTLGNFFFELGMNIVQERVQVDLLAEQERKAKKDKSAEVMHAIMSLKSGIDQSKEKTEYFQMELKKCRFCSFRTESKAVLDHHMETPHMKGTNYRCNVCKMETRTAQEVMSHMFVEHGIRARLERAPALHQCNQCPFEDNQKGKLTKHKTACDKRFRPEKNQEPPHDWEAPAKIPKPAILPQQRYQQGKNVMPNMGALTPQQQMAQQMAARGKNSGFTPLNNNPMNLQQLANAGKRQMSQMQQQANKRKGSLIQPTKQTPQQLAQQMRQGSMPMGMKNGKPVYMNGPNSVGGNNNNNKNLKSKSSNSKQVSITPLPSGRSQTSSRSQGSQGQPAMKPGQPQDGQKKGGFVICEICDGYIKDLEQLRNHMQWIHKVKIHPKMIYNRPPLNCQKCQFRFFTDQGLERHLLGSHGLVTASMQELANKGQDSGRCPVCGKVYQWKLLNHVAKDHQKVLKPAHLSYKCTVCTATFGQYKLFETHVYTAHSGGAKKPTSGNSSSSKTSVPSKSTPAKPTAIDDEITID